MKSGFQIARIWPISPSKILNSIPIHAKTPPPPTLRSNTIEFGTPKGPKDVVMLLGLSDRSAGQHSKSIQKALSLNTTKIAQLEAENASLKHKVGALNQPKRKKIKPNPNQRFIE
jgi:hypothetical protein